MSGGSAVLTRGADGYHRGSGPLGSRRALPLRPRRRARTAGPRVTCATRGRARAVAGRGPGLPLDATRRSVPDRCGNGSSTNCTSGRTPRPAPSRPPSAALDDLVELGVTAVEIMPVAQFPGRRNWGYDGVFPFAVQHSYGGARGLQEFVDECHRRDLAVVLDVVYNHLGPEGNVLDRFAPYFTDRYSTPWGRAVNLDGPFSDDVRAYFLANARQWFEDFHVDALRLDAVHELIDRSARPFLAELSAATEELGGRIGRSCALIAESADNNPLVVTPQAGHGLGMHAQWNDDFHHSVHAVLTGERDGYYGDYGTGRRRGAGPEPGLRLPGSVLRVPEAPPRRTVDGHPAGAVRDLRAEPRPSGEPSRRRQALHARFPGAPPTGGGPPRSCPPGSPFSSWVRSTARWPRSPISSTTRIPSSWTPCGEEGRPSTPTTRADRSRTRRTRPRSPQPCCGAAAVDEPMHAALRQLYRDLIALRRCEPALHNSPREDTRAYAEGNVVTLVRTHGETSVAAFFNLSGSAGSGQLPPGAQLGRAVARGRHGRRRAVRSPSNLGPSGSFARLPPSVCRRARESLARSPLSPGRIVGRRGGELRAVLGTRGGGHPPALRRPALGRALRRDPAHGDRPTRSGTSTCPTSDPGPSTATRSTVPTTPAPGTASTPTNSSSIPTPRR